MYRYKDEKRLNLTKSVGLTEEVHIIIEREKKRLFEEEKRKVSLSKIVNNLIIEKYGNA